MEDTLQMFAGSIEKSNIKSISDGIFRFGWTEASDSPMSTIWYMEFFSTVPFGAIIRNSNVPFLNSGVPPIGKNGPPDHFTPI